jgi:CRISPR-associated protein Csm1
LKESVKIATIGALLHDVGKVLYRSGNLDGRAHSISGADWLKQFTSDQAILDCIRYHHHQEIAKADLPKDSLAYVVYLADNISSGADRREIEGIGEKGFKKNRPLESIYNLLNNCHGNAVHKVATIEKNINYPQAPQAHDYSPEYKKISHEMFEALKGIEFSTAYINSLLEILEAYLSYIPSSTFLAEVSDISLFDHSKITAAVAACLVLYLESQGRQNYAQELFKNRDQFYGEQAFSLLSIDVSGVQQFIYTISSKGALKGLRSRSFYLEILLENLADELLAACSLSRANLIYTGGGHAYLLVPNTEEVKQKIDLALANYNRRLAEKFGTRLFVAHGIKECSANELMSKTADPEAYSNIFRSVSAGIAQKKLHRYSPQDLRLLNSTSTDQEGRECAICGASDDLEERETGVICSTCAAFADISNMLIRPEVVLTVTNEKVSGPYLPLFSVDGKDLYLHALEAERVKELLKHSPARVVRLYSKNTYRTGFSLATKLWLGDYAAKNSEGLLKTFADLAQNSEGVKRIGVLRADVDSLGNAFVNGFVRADDPQDKYRYVTISRTATFSRSLSIFFKYHLNVLLEKGEFSLTEKQGSRNIVIVYSGGDDLFLVGAWDEVLAAALDIRRAFYLYTGGALTLSAGFAVFDPGYPISRMAAEAAALEKAAKEHLYSGGMKNSLSLFGLEIVRGKLLAQHTYDWDTFENLVLGEKMASIAELFSICGDYGNSFLYSILQLLRVAEEEDRINLARLAYLLARREPPKSAPELVQKTYSQFTKKLYQWALDAEDRRQVITALIIYTYLKRDEKEDEQSGQF